MTEKQSKATEQWAKQLGGVQLPALSTVMQELNKVTKASDSCASELSEIILKDGALTTKVLRIANSAYHSPGTNNPITTISRAVVQLGFQGIKAISLSVMLVDSLLKQHNKERMLEWMARGFHTAVQAENLLKQMGSNEKQEEVFVTSLLLHVGEMAFWTQKSPTSDTLDQELEESSTGNTDVEEAVLGTTMKEITKALAEQWQMGSHLQEALSPGDSPSLSTEAVLLGEEISFATEKGWDSQEFRDVLVKASLFSGMSLVDVQKLIESSAEEAAGVAVNFGASKICNFIPNPIEQPVKEEKVAHLKADPQLQLDILREMGSMVEQMVDINTLFQMVVEGIHRGIGLERVALCLIDPRVNTMTAKYILGENVAEWREDMQFPVKSEQDNLFAYCLHSKKNIWLSTAHHSYQHLINKKMERLVEIDNCLISSVYTGKRSIGLIVADRGPKGLAISSEQHESFEHFSQQTNMSLAMLAANRAKK